MADYYPSEIARLVLGYLKQANCPKAWETFLVESVDLQEHNRLLQSGRSCSTNIEGKSLLDILHEYRCLKDAAERNTRNEANSSDTNLNSSHFGASNINPNTPHSAPSTSNTNPSASSENFKTPKKNNAESFNRFKIKQATQSQATVRFAQAENLSPRTLQTYLSTPTRPHSSRTPSRLQGVCVTTLNFGTGAERNEEPISVQRGLFETPKRATYARTPVRETITSQRLCFSDPLRRRPSMSSRMVQTENLNASQVDNRACQTLSDSPSLQTSTENSQQLANIVKPTCYSITDQLESNSDSRNSSNKTNMDDNLNNSRSLLPENKTTASTSVVNQTIVFTSTDIRLSGDNESSATPQYDTEPPPYARAPNTNSPRLILSFDRSNISSLTTPLKDRKQWTEEFASPRRKGTIPRRRLLSESPHPKQVSSNESNFVSIHENVENIIEELMSNQLAAQRLADNINKVIGEEPEASNSSSFPTIQDIQNSEAMIQNILARAEQESLFQDIFSLLGNSRDCDDLSIQESANETSDAIFLTEGTQTNADDCNQVPVTETIISETDSSKQHDTQKKNDGQDPLNEETSQCSALFQPNTPSSELTINQNTPAAPTIEVIEPMQVESDQTNLTQESGSKDVLGACMSIIQPDAADQLQNCNFEQNNYTPINVNDTQSTTLNKNEISGLVTASVAENVSGLDDSSTLKPVSIGTPFQVGNQVPVSQAVCNVNQPIPTTQTVVCYPQSSLTNSTMSIIPNNRPISNLPAMQNQSFIINPNFQTSPILQFSYSPAPGFPVQDGFKSNIFVVQQPCPTHAVNWTNNNLANNVIMPVQTASVENVVQTPVANASPFKIPHDYSPSKSFLASNVGNFVTVTSENVRPKKKMDKKQSSKFTIQESPAKELRGRRKAKKPPKKKTRPLWPSTKEPNCSTESEVCDDIPVLSIPDPSPNKSDSMSAMQILTSIAEGKNAQSPILKAMISSAKILADKGGRLNSTHVRTLEFSPSGSVQEEENEAKKSATFSESDARRSSPRLKHKTSCKSPCCSPSKSAENANSKKKANSKHKEKGDVTTDLVNNAIEKLTARKAVSSSMSSAVLSAMQDALQAKPVKSKKQETATTLDLFQRAGLSVSPIKKTPLKSTSTSKKNVVPRDEYFPGSSSDSDSDSDNLPLSHILASKLKSTRKEKEISPRKQNNSQKSNIEKETGTGVEVMPLNMDIEKTVKPKTNRDTEVSENVAVQLNSKPSMLTKSAVGQSDCFGGSEESVNIPKIISPTKENKSSRKDSGSNKVRSKRLNLVEQESSKIRKEVRNVKTSQSCSFSEVTGNSPLNPIVLESDEELEACKIRNKNVAAQMTHSAEGKSSKREKKKKRKKNNHSQKSTSPSKQKTITPKKSKRKNSSVSRKSSSPRISETNKLLQNEKSDSVTEKNSNNPTVNQKSSSPRVSETNKKLLQDDKSDSVAEKNSNNPSVNQKSSSPRVSETNKKLLQNEKSESVTEKNTHKLAYESCTGEENQLLVSKKSKAENSSAPKKSKEKTNETNNQPCSNEGENFSLSKDNLTLPQTSPKERCQKIGGKGEWYISSPQKAKEVVCPSLVEKSQNSFGTIKKGKNIDALCDKLRLNAVQSSPRKEGTLKSVTKAIHKVSESLVMDNANVEIKNNPLNTTNRNSTEVPATETALRNALLPSETVANENSTENGLLKLASIEIPGGEKAVINIEGRNNITLDSGTNLNSKQSSITKVPEVPNCHKRVLPPPKKRIRPVPVSSPRDGSFSPFSSFSSPAHTICFDSTFKPKEIPSLCRSDSEINKTVSDSEINKTVSYQSDLHTPSHRVSFDSTSKPNEIPAKNTTPVEINKQVSSASELDSSANAPCLDFTVKPNEMPPSTLFSTTTVKKCCTGKPKAMAEFYKSALPDRESELPISPDPMSSSSCTLDTLLAKRNLPFETLKTSPDKEKTPVNKISPEWKETEKVGQKRKLSSSSLNDSLDEGSSIKSPPRAESIVESISATKNPLENAPSLTSQVHQQDMNLSSSDEEGLIKSPVKILRSENSDHTLAHPEKKRKLSTGFSPRHKTSTNTAQIKSSETDHSFSHDGKSVEKSCKEQQSPIRHSQVSKNRLKSALKRSSIPSTIPAGVKIPNRWSNSKINNYSNTITRSEDETGSKRPKKSRPTIKVVGFISPTKPNSSFKRKTEYPSGSFRTLYSERQARKIQLENRRSPFRQSPNVNNCRSSAHRHRKESEQTTNYKYNANEKSFSRETTVRNYSRNKHELKDIPSKSKNLGQDSGTEKHVSPYESTNRRSGKFESPSSSSKVSEKHLDYQDSFNKNRGKRGLVSHENLNSVNKIQDKLTSKNFPDIEKPEAPKRNISSLKKSDKNIHEQLLSYCSSVAERKFTAHNDNKQYMSNQESSCNKQHSVENLVCENLLSSIPEKSNVLIEKNGTNLSAVSELSDKLPYHKDIELPISETVSTESQHESPSQILNNDQNVEVREEEPDKSCDKIIDEVVGSTSRTSADQNELDQAVSFLTNDEIPESQEPVISSQVIAEGSKVADDLDFGALVIQQLSKAAGLTVPMQIKDISHLLDKIKEFGLENIADMCGHKK